MHRVLRAGWPATAARGAPLAGGLQGGDRDRNGETAAEVICEGLHRRVVQQDVESDRATGHRLDLERHLNGEEGVPSEIEEVVPYPDRRDLQHLCPGHRDPLLELVSRLHERGLELRTAAVRLRQGSPVDFERAVLWQRGDGGEGGGDHETWQPTL